MICDTRATFASALAINGAAGAAFVNIGDVIDTMSPGISPSATNSGTTPPAVAGPSAVSAHGSVYLVVSAATDILSTVGAGDIVFRLVSDDVNGGTVAAPNAPSVTTCTVHNVSRSTPTALTVTNATAAGTILWVVELSRDTDYERYLGVQLLRNTNAVAAGSKINAYLTSDARAWRAFADAAN